MVNVICDPVGPICCRVHMADLVPNRLFRPVWVLLWTLQVIFAEESNVLHLRHIAVAGPGMPEYISMWSLNDQVILHCDSQSLLVDDSSVPQWFDSEDGLSHWREMIFTTKVVQKFMGLILAYAGQHENLTGTSGTRPHVCVYQAHGYCRLDPDGTVSSSVSHGYNGEDFVSFDTSAQTWSTAVPQAVDYLERRVTGAFDLNRLFHYYTYECPEMLRGILKAAPQINKKLVPQVHIFNHRNPFTSRETLCCHVTGFYPKEVRVQWLGPDGIPLVDGVGGEEVLPNEDGSYQLRRSLQLPEELQPSYSCVVLHSSMTGNITVTWEPTERSVWITTPCAAVAVCGLTVVSLLLISWRRRRRRPEDGECSEETEGVEESVSLSPSPD